MRKLRISPVRRMTLRAIGAIPLLLTALLVSGCAGGLFGGGGDKNVTPTVGDRVPVLSRIESGASVALSRRTMSPLSVFIKAYS